MLKLLSLKRLSRACAHLLRNGIPSAICHAYGHKWVTVNDLIGGFYGCGTVEVFETDQYRACTRCGCRQAVDEPPPPHPQCRSAMTFLALLLFAVPPTVSAEPGYYRPPWPSSGCQDLRAEILLDRGAAVLDRDGCIVLGGIFPDDYSRRAFLAQGWEEVQIDHLDPARRLWDLLYQREGGEPERWLWEMLYTEPSNLWITTRETNGTKSDKGPHEWCPESPAARRRAAAAIRRLRYDWQLATSPEEEQGLRAWEKGQCLKGEDQE